MIRAVRVLALAGPILLLVFDLMVSFPLEPRQDYAIPVVALTTLGVLFTVKLTLPRSIRLFGEHSDLLVPLGLYLVASRVLAWLVLLPALAAFMRPAEPISLLGMTFSLSSSIFLSTALMVVHSTWALAMICQAASGERLDLLAGWRSIRTLGWRVFSAMAVVYVGFFLAVAAAVSMATVAMPLSLLLVGIGSVVLNFATAGLLLRLVARPSSSFWNEFKDATRISLRYRWHWWAPLLSQMIVLGLVAFSHVSFRIGNSTETKTNWSVNGLWTGGFKAESAWLSKIMNAVEAEAPIAATSFLAILLGVLALAVKARIARELHVCGELADSGNEPSSSDSASETHPA